MNQGPRAAARNRAALVAAAREVYAELGLDAPMAEIARRAGVGQGSLYRHFPDRDAVVATVLEENVVQVEQAAAAEGATLAEVLAVLTWHLVESAAFIGLLRAECATVRREELGRAGELAERVERALRGELSEGGPLPAGSLMLAVAMVSGAVTGPTREDRERRALEAWALLGVEVGPVRPFPG
ncbi:TetR/AcrR family transcriptional regulator; helix-turn-helix transcriptional regulator [Streptomyces sp. CHA1]|uniref:TetR/AcrR family transcriptional regulator n=1 Tax=unclassified Streptomyces TaxID=2593676 RepID=UPI000F5532C8|nr:MULTISPECIES: TetR/AcrR family transcriptional regulator [unclassified Streptomyces]MBT3159770.1 helix-turn-helix transcriptional regulator [Streptomyces sp. G11C]MCO6700937.1 TetR/AcrR family transcriptional regulator; helix-turn-helix transcriptional regulator [Streptomyces sp. CHB9.2]MCO6707154.1 TetR/AcrR family transcriptional regulator; helix-turn-helix transcriptional regulator [Streptomyces sp. CHA3]MCO6712890.1 TetR/AcrR family transcriptional regulator; helix-turn-helix transcripti